MLLETRGDYEFAGNIQRMADDIEELTKAVNKQTEVMTQLIETINKSNAK